MMRKNGTTGISLIEMLVYMAVFGVISSVVYLAANSLLGYLRTENRQVQLLSDIEQTQRLLSRDVRRALSLPEEYAAYNANASTLLCKIATEGTAEDSPPASYAVIYALGARDGKSLVRKTVYEDGRPGPYPEKILIRGLESFVLDRPLDGQDGALQFTITLPPGRMHKGTPTTYSFVVARRND